MMNETIVSIYTTAAEAAAAIHELAAANIPSSVTSQASAAGSGQPAERVEPDGSRGFLSSPFGGEWYADTIACNPGVRRDLHVLTVKVADEHVASVVGILDRYDADEWAAVCSRIELHEGAVAEVSPFHGVGISRSTSIL